MNDLDKSGFEYKEWLALQYAKDWSALNGEEPQGDYIEDFKSHYSEEQRGYILKIVRMMRFTNSLGRTMDRSSDGQNANIVAPPPVIFGIILVAGLLLHRYFPVGFMPDSKQLLRIIGDTMFIVSGIISVPTIIMMMRNKTALNPHKETTALVTNGFFKLSRNPLYLGLLLIYCGIAVRLNSLWILCLLPLLFVALDRGVVRREEEYLERIFGEEYLEYKSNVRRWL